MNTLFGQIDAGSPLNRACILNDPTRLIFEGSYIPGRCRPNNAYDNPLYNLVALPDSGMGLTFNNSSKPVPHAIGQGASTPSFAWARNCTGTPSPPLRPGAIIHPGGPFYIAMNGTDSEGCYGPGYLNSRPSPFGWPWDNNTPFSFAAWVCFGTSQPNVIVSNASDTVSSGCIEWSIKTTTLKLRLRIVNVNSTAGRDVESSRSLTLNRWYHIAVTYDGSDTVDGIAFYINGVRDTGSYTINLDTSPGYLWSNRPYFGGNPFNPSGQRAFNGLMDQFRAYKVQLGDADIAALYAESVAGSPNLYRRVPGYTPFSCKPSPFWSMGNVTIAGQSNVVGTISNDVTLPTPVTTVATSTATGTINVLWRLIGSAISGQSTVIGTLMGPILIQGSLAAHSATTALAVCTWSLKGLVPAVSLAFGNVAVTKTLSGFVAGQSNALGKAVCTWSLVGTVPATSSLVAALGNTRRIVGIVNGICTAAAALSQTKTIKANLAALATANAALSADKTLIGFVNSQTICVGALSNTRGIVGTVSIQSTANASLSRTRPLQGSLVATSVVLAGLDMKPQLRGTINATTTAVAFGRVSRNCQGVAFATSRIDANLAATKTLAGAVASVCTCVATGTWMKSIQGTTTATSGITASLHATWAFRGVVNAASGAVGYFACDPYILAPIPTATYAAVVAKLDTVLTQGPYKPAILDGYTPGIVAADGHDPNKILTSGGAGLKTWEYAYVS